MSQRAAENERLAEKLEQLHEESPDKGYRRLNDDLRHDCGIHVNDKRVLRICQVRDIRSTVKYNNRGCTKQEKNPQYLAENLLDRQFYAAKPNEKWLTDVTEFKWYEGSKIHKLYLSAILDLCDRRIVSYVLSERNDNPLVFKTFDKAVKANPDAHPLLHSDRGFQYTNRTFHHKLVQAGMTQSMSRVAHCIDNGPMEGFWGILKRKRYYGRRFTSKHELVQMIQQDRTYLPQYTERKGSKIPENRQMECPDTLRNQQVMCSSHTTSSKKHRKLRLSVLFCCQNTETVILPAFDRRRRCCSLLRYFLRWKVFDELLHGGCRVGLLLHSKADWVVIGLLQERISILYGMRCKIRPGRMLTPRLLSTIAVMAKSSQAVKWMSDCT